MRWLTTDVPEGRQVSRSGSTQSTSSVELVLRPDGALDIEATVEAVDAATARESRLLRW